MLNVASNSSRKSAEKAASNGVSSNEGSKDAEGKVSLEEAGQRGGHRKMINRIRQKTREKMTGK